ncbi:MAG: virulence protein [Clostridiales bacterium]|nr:virulence protein [Clostridiales bacterium]
MRINFNRTGAERKALVTAMGEILEVAPKYLGMPSASYEVDYFTIDREGTVIFSDRADSEEVENLLEQLAKRGFIAESGETSQEETAPEAATETEEAADETETDSEETTDAEDTDSDAPWLTISLPLDKVDAGKLTRILEAKGNLIKKALGVDDLPIEIGEDTISFPWFQELPDADTSTAYTHFVSALCRMSKEQKRVTATEKEVDNEKYAFRCFLLRLGFIGEEYKTDRKILLKNLTGSSAFKSGSRKEAAADEA